MPKFIVVDTCHPSGQAIRFGHNKALSLKADKIPTLIQRLG
jgi:hypothetical protein